MDFITRLVLEYRKKQERKEKNKDILPGKRVEET
jgi:hypothetical protein